MTLRPLFAKQVANRKPHKLSSLDFELPPELEADAPPEARGFERDEVRLMVSSRGDGRVVHARFRDLGGFLEAGDVLVINTSGTMNAAISAERELDGTTLKLHLSTRLPASLWNVELRRPSGTATEPFLHAAAGETLRLLRGASVTLRAPYPSGSTRSGGTRLWISTLDLPGPLDEYLERHGSPIRYGYVREDWPAIYYQTVYATEKGSAEMPSAGRAFTLGLITRLVAQGVQIAPLILHTGVASLEEDEPPYEEFYRIPPETATDPDGVTHPGEGYTDLFVTPERGIRAVDAMLTGLHEPHSTHLAMLEALADHAPAAPTSNRPPTTTGREHLEAAYAEALREGYLWHEFGDLHLILP